MSALTVNQVLTCIATHSYNTLREFDGRLTELENAAKTDAVAQDIFITLNILREVRKRDLFLSYIYQLLECKPRDKEGVRALFLPPLGISQFHLPPLFAAFPGVTLTPLEEPFELTPSGVLVKKVVAPAVA